MIPNTFHAEDQKKFSHRHTKLIRLADLPPKICAPLHSVSRISQRSNLKILGARRAKQRKFDAEDQQTLGATAQNSVGGATWGPGFAHPWSIRTWLLKWQSVQHAAPTLTFWHSSSRSEWLPSHIKGKGKGRLWVLQHCCLEAYCTLTQISSFIHLQRRCTHQAAWETSASEGRNYTWNLASNP